MGFILEASICYGFPLVTTKEDQKDRMRSELERFMRVLYADRNSAQKFALIGFGDSRRNDDKLPCGNILAPRESIIHVLHNNVHEFGQSFPVFEEALKEKWRQELKCFCEEIGIPFHEPQLLLSANYS